MAVRDELGQDVRSGFPGRWLPGKGVGDEIRVGHLSRVKSLAHRQSGLMAQQLAHRDVLLPVLGKFGQ